MKTFLFEQFSREVANDQDINNIIRLINCLEGNPKDENKENEEKNKDEDINNKDKLKKDAEKNINEFLKKLLEKNLFTKDEFFSNKKSFKINLLYELFKRGIIKKNKEDYYQNIQELLTNIKKDLDGNIKKIKLEQFLKNNKSFIKERLSLINIILPGLGFDPEENYKTLQKEYSQMATNIKDLIHIKENIIKFYKETYKDLIKDLIDNIKVNDKMNINEYKKGKIGELIRQCEEKRLKEKADRIKDVKDFLLFNVIYEMNAGKDEETHFKDAYKKYENIGKFLNKKGNVNKLYEDEENKKIINKIRDILCNNEEEAKNFIEKLKKLYNINDDNIIDEITILFNTKKYDLEINSIIFFFEYFQKNSENWNKKLSKKYKNLPKESPEEIKKRLNELKEDDIYNYRGKNNYYTKLFTCLYNKKEAIDFIFEKINQNINIDYLEEKIQPTNRTINIEDIIATEGCIFHINKMKDQNDNFERLKYIKNLPPEEIDKFEKYSQIYPYIIELDRIDDFSDNIYEQVIKIIKIDFIPKIDLDSEDFSYYLKDQSDPETITMEELIHLKNKIHSDSEK